MSLARVVLRLGAPRASLSIASRGFVTSREAVERLVGTSLDTGEGAIDSAFLALDKNSDGVIQPDELAAGLKTRVGLELSDDKVEKLVARYSKRGDNVINLEEYAALLDDARVHRFFCDLKDDVPTAAPPAAPAAKPRAVAPTTSAMVTPLLELCRNASSEGGIDEIFNQVDMNGEGVVQPIKLQRWLQSLGVNISMPQVYRLFAQHDAGGDGVLHLAEFASLLDSGLELRDDGTGNGYGLIEGAAGFEFIRTSLNTP